MGQKAMADPEQEAKARELYETVGVYLGYGLAQYCEFYKIDHVMILGRVSKGKGGDVMLQTAQKVLQTEFPDLPPIQFHTADDHFKAVGQCIAAAALPTVGDPAEAEQNKQDIDKQPSTASTVSKQPTTVSKQPTN